MRKRGSQKLALIPGTTVPAALEFHQPATALLRAVALIAAAMATRPEHAGESTVNPVNGSAVLQKGPRGVSLSHVKLNRLSPSSFY